MEGKHCGMEIVEIRSLEETGVRPYAELTGGTARSGMVIVESPKVIERALDAGLRPISMLCERKHIDGDAACLLKRMGNVTVYTGERDTLARLTGYTLTRGVLCAMHRPELPSADEILKESRRICVVYDVCDSTNVGVIFRTAAALGYDGVIVSPSTCDPFNRRAVRVSMGAVFQIPWTIDSDIPGSLKANGFESIGMALSDKSVFLQDFNPGPDRKIAPILGSEGYGLPDEVIAQCDHIVKIPMHHGVDSLNVGAAAAIALWHLGI